MFKEIKTLIGEIDAKYIFPSFVTPGRVQMTYLKQKGYGFIEVVDGKELKDILFN